MRVVLTNDQRKILFNESKQSSPKECCALLFGEKNNTDYVVKEIFKTKNIDESSKNFTISNEELINAYNQAERDGHEVIGIFHSHPDSIPYPSETDKKFMEINPVIWLIFSAKTEDFKAFILETEINEIPIIFNSS